MASDLNPEVEHVNDVYMLTSILLENKEDSLEQLLRAACKIFNAELGIICLIKDNKYIVESFYSELPYSIDFDSVKDVTQTFCYYAIDKDIVLALPDVANSEYNHLACNDVLKVKSYIAIPIKLDNKEVGTINFSSREVRADGFSKNETNLLVYLNQWIAHHLNRKFYKDSLWKKNKELETKNTDLEEVMEENKQLMQILVHDLKSPLSNIKMLSYLFQDFARDPDSEELIAIFNKSLEYVFHLIEQMETLNNMENFPLNNYLEEFDLDAFVKSNVKDFTNIAESKSIKLNYSFKGDRKTVKTDMNFLKRILYNLISNALKFSPFKKQIFIELSHTENQYTIAITDEGPGIEESEQTKLFEKFVKLKNRPTNSESSSGLGLFIVKELLKNIKGDIHLKSKPGEGSTFIVTIPFAI